MFLGVVIFSMLSLTENYSSHCNITNNEETIHLTVVRLLELNPTNTFNNWKFFNVAQRVQ